MSTAIREAVYGDACALRARRETEVLLEERVREKRRTRPLFYALLLGGTALCAAAGLFAGMLLPYSAAAMAVAGRDTAMGSSLFGMAVELLRGSLPAADSVYAAVLQGLLLFLVGAAALSLLSSAIAFAAGRTARKLFAFSSTLVLFGYTAFSALVLLGAETLREALPLDALAACAGTLLFRLLSALFGRRGKGMGSLLLFVLAAASFAGLCCPGAPLKRDLISALGGGALPEGERLVLLTLAGVAAGNLAIGVLRAGAGKGFAFDLFRFLLQCAATGAAAAVYAAEEMNFYFFTRDPFAFGLLALPALLGLILSAALLAVRAAKNKPTANADG